MYVCIYIFRERELERDWVGDLCFVMSTGLSCYSKCSETSIRT